MEQKFTPADLETACDDLSMLPYFPHEARASVIALLARMVPHREALRWLVDECVNHLSKWPGPGDLRGLLCTRYDPADGVDAWCSLPGYTAADSEAKTIECHEQVKIQEKIGGYVEESFGEQIRRIAGQKMLPAPKKAEVTHG